MRLRIPIAKKTQQRWIRNWHPPLRRPPRPEDVPIFRPITSNPYEVKIPPIKRELYKNQRRTPFRVEPTDGVGAMFTAREKEEIRRVAAGMGISMGTLLRVAVKRFLRMPELPLRPDQLRLWQQGYQRNGRMLAQKDRLQFQQHLLDELDRRRRLPTTDLEQKFEELLMTYPDARKVPWGAGWRAHKTRHSWNNKPLPDRADQLQAQAPFLDVAPPTPPPPPTVAPDAPGEYPVPPAHPPKTKRLFIRGRELRKTRLHGQP